MGCKCSEIPKEKDLLTNHDKKYDELSCNTANAQISAHAVSSKPSNNKVANLIIDKPKPNEKMLIKEASLPDNKSTFNSGLVMQRSINQSHFDPTKFTMHTDIFKRENKQSIYNNYDILNIIGKGSFGEVRLAKHKITNEQRAVKIIEKQYCDVKLEDEIKILQQLDHPNILKLYEFFQDQQYYYIVLEYCSGGELFEKIISLKSLSEMKTAKIMQQILSAVVYCHQNNICHRDLKPENLLLEEDNIDSNIKVIDFGTSKWFKKNERMKEKYGTPYYIAPEVLKKDYNEKCDIWSCGVILYIMLSGYPPFGGKTNEIIMKKVLEGSFSFNRKEWNIISDKAKLLITKMLTYNPEKRISAKDALSDPWITQYAGKAPIEVINGKNGDEVIESIDMLRNFKLQQNLQAATLTFYASHLQTKSEEKRLRNLFKQFDKNGDGVLSKDELIEGLSIHYNDRDKAVIEVNDMMERIDVNHDGVVNYTEFIMAQVKNIDLISTDKLRAAFNAFDLVLFDIGRQWADHDG